MRIPPHVDTDGLSIEASIQASIEASWDDSQSNEFADLGWPNWERAILARLFDHDVSPAYHSHTRDASIVLKAPPQKLTWNRTKHIL